jgi:hypothetical protein
MSTVDSWRERLFGDRGAGLRAGLVLGALVALTVYAEIAWEYTYPAIDRCLAEPARYDGRTTALSPARIEAADATGFSARDMRGAVARVEAPAGAAAAGDTVALRGVFRASAAPGRAPGYIALDVVDGRPAIRPAPSGFEKRYAMFAVSAGVLAYAAWRFLRRFRFEGGQITLKSR